ncbi:MAG: translocation/assembly module TamB [Bacteroidetes bacterium]|nr:translocation/assembly module TamB [Bacteroidota bacterium]MCL2301699.1 translocation/assembly module TamB [Lentimicrobiaceae bacterium]
MLKKITKGILKIILWIIGVFITLNLLIVTLLFVPPIQQFVISKVSNLLTNITGGEITMDRIYLSPFFTLTAKNFAIKDHHYNNMIFATTLKGRINFVKTGRNQVTLSFAKLNNGEVMLRKYAGEDAVNIAIWAEGFKKEEKKEPKFKLLFESIVLDDVRFVFINDDKRLYKDDNTIDYAFFELQHIKLDVDNFLVFGPDISCKINSLTLSQHTGFEISSFTGNFRIYREGLLLDGLHFTTPNSIFTGDFAFRYSDFPDYSDFVNLINFDTKVKSASIAMQDVIYFAPALKGMDNQFVFSGHVGGTVNHLKTKDVYLKYKFQTYFSGNLAIENILDFKNSIFDVYAKDANINFSELTQFKLPKSKTINLPPEIRKLTYSRIRGNYRGSLTKFNTDLFVQTNLGTVQTKITTTSRENTLLYSGTIACNNLELGRILNQPKYLNRVSLRSVFEGNAAQTKNIKDLFSSISLRMRGNITHIDICGYSLKDVNFNGNYIQQQVSLAAKSTDSLASFNVKGNIKFANALPTIAASLTHVDIKLYEFFSHFPHHIDSVSAEGFDKLIHKVQQTPNLEFTMDSIAIVMSGTQFENFNGYVSIDYARLTNRIKTSRIDWFRLNAINKPNSHHQYQIHSNAFNASLKTNYNFKDLITTAIEAAHYHLPEMFIGNNEMKKISCTDSMQFIDIDIQTYYTRNLSDLLFPKLNLGRNASIYVHLGKTRNEDSFNFSFPQVDYAGIGKVNNLKANGKINKEQLLAIQLQCDSITIYQKKGNNLTFSSIEVGTSSDKKEIKFTTSWHNPPTFSVSGLNSFDGLLFSDIPHLLSLKVTDSKLFLRESMWQFVGDDNIISFGEQRYLFDHCILASDVGKISVNGEISKRSDKECNIQLENFDISLVNSLTSRMGMTFGGDMSLAATITPNIDHFRVRGQTFVKNFVFNEELMGDLFLNARILNDGEPHFNGGILSSSDSLYIDLSNFTYYDYLALPNKIIMLSGRWFNKEKELRVRAEMDTLRIGFLSPFLASFSNVVSGEASGVLDFIMNRDSLYFDGKVRVKNAKLGITPLNTVYYITDQEILFNREGIDFNQVLLTDKFNNAATLSGFVHHTKFKDFRIDLNIATPRIMVLNTPRRTDDPFFGDGFVSGDVSIRGDTRQLDFTSRNIRTLSGSIITFPLSSASTVSSSQGIYFVQSAANKENTTERVRQSNTILNFDFMFDITRDADVKLELDPIDGLLRCKTSGRLHLTYNSNFGNINLDGILAIVSGRFNMSLRNFFPRDFTIVEGGTISFSGPLTSAQLDVSALYQRAASLTSLSGSLSNIGRTDVQAFLGLTGNLMNPTPTFTFAFPRLVDREQMQVFSVLNTENQQTMIRQFFSFVFLNTFINAESDMTAASVGTGIEMVSGILTSFISNQLNNVNIGVNYINNQGDFNYTEYSVNAEVNLNDRFRLRTNLGYGENSTTSNFVGDVNFEMGLNEARNWILRLFYFNDINQDALRPQQGGGVGVTYRHEFNNRKDFLESWTPKKKEEKDTTEQKQNSLNPIKNEQ